MMLTDNRKRAILVKAAALVKHPKKGLIEVSGGRFHPWHPDYFHIRSPGSKIDLDLMRFASPKDLRYGTDPYADISPLQRKEISRLGLTGNIERRNAKRHAREATSRLKKEFAEIAAARQKRPRVEAKAPVKRTARLAKYLSKMLTRGKG